VATLATTAKRATSAQTNTTERLAQLAPTRVPLPLSARSAQPASSAQPRPTQASPTAAVGPIHCSLRPVVHPVQLDPTALTKMNPPSSVSLESTAQAQPQVAMSAQLEAIAQVVPCKDLRPLKRVLLEPTQRQVGLSVFSAHLDTSAQAVLTRLLVMRALINGLMLVKLDVINQS
jgi:hypothetical protein